MANLDKQKEKQKEIISHNSLEMSFIICVNI